MPKTTKPYPETPPDNSLIVDPEKDTIEAALQRNGISLPETLCKIIKSGDVKEATRLKAVQILLEQLHGRPKSQTPEKPAAISIHIQNYEKDPDKQPTIITATPTADPNPPPLVEPPKKDNK